jgi:hypothetical protein
MDLMVIVENELCQIIMYRRKQCKKVIGLGNNILLITQKNVKYLSKKGKNTEGRSLRIYPNPSKRIHPLKYSIRKFIFFPF